MYDKYGQLAALVGAGKRVLDVGCADGYLSATLKHAGNEVMAIELLPVRAARAREAGIDVVVGDVCEESCWRQVPGAFDVVILSDIIEHLTTPRSVLERVRHILAPHGYVLISLPNIAYYRIRLQMLAGKFEYADEGILAHTHVHFYTLATARELITSCGFAIDRVTPPNESVSPVKRRLLSVLLPRFPSLFASGFIFMAHAV